MIFEGFSAQDSTLIYMIDFVPTLFQSFTDVAEKINELSSSVVMYCI